MHAVRKISVPNRLLAELPRKTFDVLAPHLEPVNLQFGDILYEPGTRIRNLYFPYSGVVSLLTAVDDKRAAEVGLIGPEGLVGVQAVLGVNTSSMRAVVQGTGTAMRISPAVFGRMFRKQPALQSAVFLFVHSLMAQVAQTAACNRFHQVGQRLARWLLMTQDRVKSPEFLLTHNFLAKMLGVRRVGVTQAASVLQKHKLISYSRGKIIVLDRTGLLASTCSCYAAVNRIYSGK